MEKKIVEIQFIDSEDREVVSKCYLVNPDPAKLEELKYKIEHRFDAMLNDSSTDEEIVAAEKFNDNVWENIDNFITENFTAIAVEEFKIEY